MYVTSEKFSMWWRGFDPAQIGSHRGSQPEHVFSQSTLSLQPFIPAHNQFYSALGIRHPSLTAVSYFITLLLTGQQREPMSHTDILSPTPRDNSEVLTLNDYSSNKYFSLISYLIPHSNKILVHMHWFRRRGYIIHHFEYTIYYSGIIISSIF